MIKPVIAAAAVFIFVGCGETTGDSSNQASGTGDTSYYVNSGGGDVTINDTTVGENGTYIQNADGTVTFTSGNDNTMTLPDGTEVDVADEPSGDYDPEYTAEECAANGYFWCPLANQCQNSPASGSACTR